MRKYFLWGREKKVKSFSVGWRRRHTSIRWLSCRDWAIHLQELREIDVIPGDVSSAGTRGMFKSPPTIRWPSVKLFSFTSVLF